MTIRASLLLALAAVPACKGKSSDKAAAPAGSGTATATLPSASGSAPTPPPPDDAVKLPAGAAFGCLGWSATANVAACITGETSWTADPRYQLDLVGGSEPATRLAAKRADSGDTFEEAAATAANAKLAKLGVQPFSGLKEVKAGATTDLGGGASLAWTTKQTDEGGVDNTAPTNQHAIVVTCANKQTVEILEIEEEGTEPEIEVWSVPDHAVIELITKVAREGEYRETSTAMLLELATCELIRPPA